MNDERFEPSTSSQDDWQGAHRARDIQRFAPLVPVSTAGGCLIAAACLWSAVAGSLLSAWLAVGLVVALAQWQSQRWLARGRWGAAVGDDAAERRGWIAANALVSGLFWGASSLALFPAGSMAHQLLLAFVLVAVAALWLPLFALTRLALLAFAVPGLLPMAFALLASPQPPQTTMGSLLVLLIGVFAAVAQTTRRIFFADVAARRELYRQATHDCLVGLANRGEFHRRAHQLDVLGEQPYAIVYIDLDHFKEVNDTAGHAAGDELLCRIGAILKDAVRKEDLAARLGGDEFAILMHDCTAADAAQVASNVLERIRGFVLTSGERRRPLSASMGVACSADLFTSPSKLLEAADQACYAAKRGGRNRIEIATGLAVPAARPAGTARFALVSDVPA